ncbi:MAG: dihydrolipoyl dehydrogenase [Chitinophagaceae bacterium]|jgi:dihydrolipoamide dehydrogenase|nr:dihydrolipoyl dehydrogenase [Chitinophagaceae bacterium]MBK7678272.1 dihydrolipoyl dehydrogenase [Chitinophagaceae bacterium]MBK9464576.1 dihydrolipoyl dehydrogenase [Chitinophagaceae bacterium]MBK9660068.1 dihydrolipoyl dehydrogenase [Chitinophagaceae bacterium]MBK9939229.1 dihydrolipoyl dehydrogenase [Chitinophagaceae bacterium]
MAYDVVVLGSGPGGYVAAIRASQLGFKTAIIEKESLGGVCLNWGCIPTKALLKSAQVMEDIKHASGYGIEATGKANFEAVIKRSRGVADKMSKGVQFLMKKNKIDVVMGFGKLKAKGQIEVTAADGSKKIVEGKHIIIATGGRSRELPALKQDGKKIIGYRDAMNLPTQPKSIIVVGSGAIGVEFGYFYNSMGTKVTIVEFLPRIVPVEDEEISKELDKNFKKSGIDIMVNSEVISVDTAGAGVKATVKTADGEKILEADILLSAVGVIANLEGIGLEELGIKTDKGRILVDKYGQTNVPGFYAIGDCAPGQALAHVASKEAIITVENIGYNEKKYSHQPEALDYNNVPGCTYCYPEIASVGYTEKQAKEAGYDVKVGKFPLSASGKASAAGHTEGFVKVVFDAKYGEWLGTHMIGYNVTEIIIETVLGRKLETTYHEVLNSIHPHPTISESVKDAIEVAYGEAIHL